MLRQDALPTDGPVDPPPGTGARSHWKSAQRIGDWRLPIYALAIDDCRCGLPGIADWIDDWRLSKLSSRRLGHSIEPHAAPIANRQSIHQSAIRNRQSANLQSAVSNLQ